MIKSYIRHTGIVVKNIERSIEFYSKYFNLKPNAKVLESGEKLDAVLNLKKVNVTTCKLYDDNKNCVELLQFHSIENEDKKSLTTFGTTHIAFTVSDLKSLYNEMNANGVEFHSPPILSEGGNVLFTFCKDLDGTYLELVEVLR